MLFFNIGSLRNLTEQVQKEVELAVELDENMLKSLESNSRNSSFLEDMFKISTTLSADLKRLLFKILQEGFEVSIITFALVCTS